MRTLHKTQRLTLGAAFLTRAGTPYQHLMIPVK